MTNIAEPDVIYVPVSNTYILILLSHLQIALKAVCLYTFLNAFIVFVPPLEMYLSETIYYKNAQAHPFRTAQHLRSTANHEVIESDKYTILCFSKSMMYEKKLLIVLFAKLHYIVS